MQVGRLRDRVAKETGLPCDRLKLVHKGRGLTSDQEKLRLQENGDSSFPLSRSRPSPTPRSSCWARTSPTKGSMTRGQGHLRVATDALGRCPPCCAAWREHIASSTLILESSRKHRDTVPFNPHHFGMEVRGFFLFSCIVIVYSLFFPVRV